MTWLLAFIAALPYADRWVTGIYDDRADQRAREQAAAAATRRHAKDMAGIGKRDGAA